MKSDSILFRIVAMLVIYLALKYLIPYGDLILYPVSLLVTILHELGHGIGALITGGYVDAIQINTDGSGWTRTGGGWVSVILMGGYLGSAIFGNLIFRAALKTPHWSPWIMMFLAALLVFTALVWFNSLLSSGILIAFAIGLLFLARLEKFQQEFLGFIGLASIIHIIEDFNVGPTSDLKAYSDIFVIVPAAAWMYIWLGIVLLMLYFNLKGLLRKDWKKITRG